jgi:hypothetical protein
MPVMGVASGVPERIFSGASAKRADKEICGKFSMVDRRLIA